MLRLEGIHAGYNGSSVLHGIDLVVPAGAAVALLGANGAGKTTLLRVAAGTLRPTSGRVLLDEEPLSRWPFGRSRQGVCLIPEGRGVFRHLTVRENLAMFARGRAVPEAIERAVDVFPVLGERLGQLAGTLSGGQQQMLAMSRAFVTAPKVVLADELSVGLAPVVVDEIFGAIDRLKAEGRSILLVEQYVDRALAEVEVAYILHKGHIAYAGEAHECADDLVYSRYLGQIH